MFVLQDIDTQKIIDTQKDIIVITNGIEMYKANRAFLEYFGYETLEQFLKNHSCICDFFQTDEQNRYLQASYDGISWIQFVESNPQTNYKVKLIDQNGLENIFEITHAIFYEDDDQTLRTVSFHNITKTEDIHSNLEKLIAEKTKQLQYKNKELLQINKLLSESSEIINNYTDVTKTDLRGHITYASAMFCETMGYEYSELIGKSHNIVKSPYSEKETFQKLWETIGQDNVFRGVIQNRTKDARVIWFEALIKPDYDIDGKKIGYVAYRKNITNEKNLQRLVEKQVEQIRLKDSQLNEQAKITAMAKLIENLAHQWRQPLSLISTVATGLSLKLEYNIFEKGDALTSLHKLDESAQFLSHTIDDFRDFFKKDKLAKKFSLKENCKKCVSMIQASLNSSKIEIIKSIPEDDIIVYGFQNELSQAVLNILNNAKDALDNSHEEKKFIFTSLCQEKDNAIITIKDTGGGIPDNIIEHIFEPYFTTKHQSVGTGIGLFMTKEIISKHFGGTIDVANEDTFYAQTNFKGAKFIITIPIENI